MSEEEHNEIVCMLSDVCKLLHGLVDDMPNDRSKAYVGEAVRNIEKAKSEINNNIEDE